MLHQAAIVQVIATERVKVARELQVLVKGGEVAGRAGVARVAAAMNDPRVGAQGGDQSEVQEIERHLVRDPERVRGDARQLLQVAAGMAAHAAGIEGEKTPRVAIRCLRDFGRDSREGRKLAACRNLRAADSYDPDTPNRVSREELALLSQDELVRFLRVLAEAERGGSGGVHQG